MTQIQKPEDCLNPRLIKNKNLQGIAIKQEETEKAELSKNSSNIQRMPVCIHFFFFYTFITLPVN